MDDTPVDEIGDLSRALQTLTGALERHIRSIESFSADVSHEFKNPLASIRTATEMLAEVDREEDRERFIRIIQQEIARMENLLSGIREVTLIDAELQRESRDVVSIGEVARQVVDEFRMREADGVIIRYEEPAEVRASVARERLGQVLENLLANAVSFTPSGGEVELSVTAVVTGW